MITAIEFGKKYESCEEAMIWRRSLPNGTTQAEAYLVCPRGDWLIWQLMRGCVDQRKIGPTLKRAVTKIVARAIRRAVRSLRDNREPWAKKYRGWARRWLKGEDRSRISAAAAQGATAPYYASAAVVASWSADAADAYAAIAASYAANVANTVTYGAADAAAYAGAVSSACRKEQKQQARDIRSEISKWPGKE